MMMMMMMMMIRLKRIFGSEKEEVYSNMENIS
jgi:hypothetical protein